MKLQEKLYQLRKKQGITQAELAEKLEVSRQSVSNWETGKVIPTTTKLKDLSCLYHVSFEYLLNDDEDLLNVQSMELQNENAPSIAEKTKIQDKRKWFIISFSSILFLIILVVLGILLGIHGNKIQSGNTEDAIPLDQMDQEIIDMSSENNFSFV